MITLMASGKAASEKFGRVLVGLKDWLRARARGLSEITGIVALLVVVFLAVAAYQATVSDTTRGAAWGAAFNVVTGGATVLLVTYTALQLRRARLASNEAAQDTLLQRLDTRAPTVSARLDGAFCNVLDDDRQSGSRFASDSFPFGWEIPPGEPLDGTRLTITMMVNVNAYGQAPVFAAAVPGPLKDADPATMRSVAPGSDTTVVQEYTFIGEDIRRRAHDGAWSAREHDLWWLTWATVSVFDATRTVEDFYTFQTNWWPFTIREDGTIVIEPNSRFGPRYAPARRIYHTEQLREANK